MQVFTSLKRKYVTGLLKCFHMEKANSLPTPMVSNISLSSERGSPISNPQEYRNVVGALQINCN